MFLNSQQKWFEYRDAECDFFASFYGGSSQPMYVYSRRLELTMERVRVLSEMIEPFDDK
jgi:uncharacterized protein YecT (DUF1311 family)